MNRIMASYVGAGRPPWRQGSTAGASAGQLRAQEFRRGTYPEHPTGATQRDPTPSNDI